MIYFGETFSMTFVQKLDQLITTVGKWDLHGDHSQTLSSFVHNDYHDNHRSIISRSLTIDRHRLWSNKMRIAEF